jgi:hypothetical protein
VPVLIGWEQQDAFFGEEIGAERRRLDVPSSASEIRSGRRSVGATRKAPCSHQKFVEQSEILFDHLEISGEDLLFRPGAMIARISLGELEQMVV